MMKKIVTNSIGFGNVNRELSESSEELALIAREPIDLAVKTGPT